MIFRQPSILQYIFKHHARWSFPERGGEIFLTFDDGPTPGITEEVLAVLKEYNAEATFFCTGNNVQQHTPLYQSIIAHGHAVGNHTFSHLNGWKTPCETYLNDITTAQKLINSRLFRPPYGKLSYRQYRALKQDFDIIMWDVMSYDFDEHLSTEHCFDIIKRNIKSGSIIVFHDTQKAYKNMMPTLMKTLAYCRENNILPRKIVL